MAEAFRSGLDNVPPIQVESALSLGMSKSQVFTNIILPQAVSNSIPAFCANAIFLIKETSVFSAVALADRIMVIHAGRVSGFIDQVETTSQEDVLKVAFQ